MRLTCTYNVRSAGRSGFSSNERIVATYSESTKATTILVDADIVTIGLTAKLLQEQYDIFFRQHPDLKERVDAAISEALNQENKNESY